MKTQRVNVADEYATPYNIEPSFMIPSGDILKVSEKLAVYLPLTAYEINIKLKEFCKDIFYECREKHE